MIPPIGYVIDVTEGDWDVAAEATLECDRCTAFSEVVTNRSLRDVVELAERHEQGVHRT